MSEGYLDEVERQILAQYEAEMEASRRRDRAILRQWRANNLGLVGLNLGLLGWNVVECLQSWSWFHVAGGGINLVTLVCMAWKLWPRRKPPAAAAKAPGAGEGEG